ncbi:MAG: gliding motility-associated C-terminal domain-containing protein [Candidatus Cyclobacteriaceae bacterium M3_2C_046]
MRPVFSIFFLASIGALVHSAQATHIRAGEITAELINCNSFTYQITLTVYTDTDGVEFGGGELHFGDGDTVVFSRNTDAFVFKEDLGNKIEINQFTTRHNFPGAGSYTIWFFERNRNQDVLNMYNSVGTPFYVETNIIIDPLQGCNNTPVLKIPPIDQGCSGKIFEHNPGAYDPDAGDSLSYHPVVNKQFIDLEVYDYRFPNDPEFGGTIEGGSAPATYSIDSEGTLTWNSPGMAGEYNLAFMVKEWRLNGKEWEEIGYVVRDMQVIIEDCENEPPELIVPNDTCIEAGTKLDEFIIGIDPDNHPVKIEAFGEGFEVLNPAVLLPDSIGFRPSPDSVKFNWFTDCNHIRADSYQFNFKVTDMPSSSEGPSLVDFEVWNVTVIGPSPKNPVVSILPGRTTKIDWDPYTCSNAVEIQIWRRVGSYPYELTNCETGIPSEAGYQLAGQVTPGENTYVDDNNGQGLEFGANYCYRLVAVFPNGVESYASEEVCIAMPVSGPIITNVSIQTTDDTDGEILVKWVNPIDIDQSLFPPPYYYELYRSEGYTGNSNRLLLNTERINDTSYIDTGLNTLDQIYNYRVYLYDANNQLVDSSAAASSVRLSLKPETNAINLTWQAEVPWSNLSEDYPWHYIYRNHSNRADPDELNLIDSVHVLQNGLYYQDDGSTTGSAMDKELLYCYLVSTRGDYDNPLIPPPLINLSQEICAQPNDTIPPCTPVDFAFLDFSDPAECEEAVKTLPCNFTSYSNEIGWSLDRDTACEDDILSFNIYYSRTGKEESYDLIANVTNTKYLHQDLRSFAGCYRIAAVDRSGNESELSQPICKDNCPVYVLPNVITPNQDGVNDMFEPKQDDINCPRFIKTVHFQVFNRWGVEVYDSRKNDRENNILIQWGGYTNEGNLVSSGVYYYLARVEYIALDPDQEVVEYKGYIHVFE